MFNRPAVKDYISVVIPTKDRREELKSILKELAKQTDNFFEVIVVDASAENQAKVIREWLKILKAKFDFQYIRSSMARSSYQRKMGTEHSLGQIMVFLDDDFLIPKNHLAKIRKQLSEDEESKGGQAMFYTDGPLGAKILETIFFLNGYSPIGSGKIKLSGAFQPNKEVTEPKRTRCIATGCCFYRKEVFDNFVFDETIPTSCSSDLEFSYRVSQKYLLKIYPNLKCHHRHIQKGKPKIRLRAKNFIYFQARHFKRNFLVWWRVPFFLWAQVGYLIRFSTMAIRDNNPDYLRGWADGWKKILSRLVK